MNHLILLSRDIDKYYSRGAYRFGAFAPTYFRKKKEAKEYYANYLKFCSDFLDLCFVSLYPDLLRISFESLGSYNKKFSRFFQLHIRHVYTYTDLCMMIERFINFFRISYDFIAESLTKSKRSKAFLSSYYSVLDVYEDKYNKLINHELRHSNIHYSHELGHATYFKPGS